jgi:hypothetical protein
MSKLVRAGVARRNVCFLGTLGVSVTMAMCQCYVLLIAVLMLVLSFLLVVWIVDTRRIHMLLQECKWAA